MIMQNVVGQSKLVSIFTGYTINTMPSTLLLLGEKGSGKTYLTQRLAKHLNLELVHLSSSTSAEDLISFAQSPVVKLYHIDLSEVSDKAQNKFLKFIEEPTNTVKIILEAESEVGVLPTILNRCHKLTFEAYSIEELQSFAWSPKALNPIAYRFYNTPGKLNTLSNPDMFVNLQEFCNQLLIYFPAGKDMDYANAMTACVKICTKKEDTYKFDFEVFFDMFAYSAFENYKATGNIFSLEAYLYTTKYKQQMLNKSVAKEAALLNFLSTLWRIAHDTKRS
jgi:tRNA A37 threonylcarbamoyladenosine biosynthesis protein TsaE